MRKKLAPVQRSANSSSFRPIHSQPLHTSPAVSPTETPVTVQDLCHEALDLNVPDSEDAHNMHNLYCVQIFSIAKTLAKALTCIICDEVHPSEHCPVLNNQGHGVRPSLNVPKHKASQLLDPLQQKSLLLSTSNTLLFKTGK